MYNACHAPSKKYPLLVVTRNNYHSRNKTKETSDKQHWFLSYLFACYLIGFWHEKRESNFSIHREVYQVNAGIFLDSNSLKNI